MDILFQVNGSIAESYNLSPMSSVEGNFSAYSSAPVCYSSLQPSLFGSDHNWSTTDNIISANKLSHAFTKTTVSLNSTKQSKQIVNRRRFVCEACGTAFTKRHNLNSHMVSHSGIKPYACCYCGKKISRKSDCRRHELKHCKKRPQCSTSWSL